MKTYPGRYRFLWAVGYTIYLLIRYRDLDKCHAHLDAEIEKESKIEKYRILQLKTGTDK